MPTVFSGDCEVCRQFKTRCANVHRVQPKFRGVYEKRVAVMCDDCRRKNKNRFRLATDRADLTAPE